jgi:predicted nuclease of predicted toxin-antitoxin system
VRFLADAQLPCGLASFLEKAGHDCLHTSSLPHGNHTTDAEICLTAETENRIIITKDSDFVNSHLLTNRPSRLLLVSTGNIANKDLLEIFQNNLPALETAFSTSVFVEIGRATLIVHQ